MTKSKTLIDRQIKKKFNPELVESAISAKKNDKWLRVAEMLSMPRSKKIAVNLDRIERESKEGDIVVIPGKVLGKGNLSKRVRVVALSFSEEAGKKLKESKCEVVKITDEIKSNPKAQGVKILE